MKVDRSWLFVGLGCAVTLVAWIVANAAGIRGDGNFTVLVFLFPYASLMAGVAGGLGFALAILLLVVQFPLYGFLIAKVSARPSAKLLMAILLLLHAVVAAICLAIGVVPVMGA